MAKQPKVPGTPAPVQEMAPPPKSTTYRPRGIGGTVADDGSAMVLLIIHQSEFVEILLQPVQVEQLIEALKPPSEILVPPTLVVP